MASGFPQADPVTVLDARKHETYKDHNHKPCPSDMNDEDLNHEKAVPIAVIGYSIKFPQEATSSDAFWRMLVEGRSARTGIPSERFNIDSFYHSDIDRHDNLNVREGHFVQEDLAAFDAPFFAVSPAEAASMDPQQRGLLETAYRAFENAGISMAKAAGSRTSVHVGSFANDWKEILSRDPLRHQDYEATGSASSILANRLSWFYDLTGPSVSLDTACSSSLMALHLSCQCLRSGEASMGVIGGANVILDPGSMAPIANLGMLSPNGVCYSFDHRANGYARGEGFGVVVIKLLSEALRDNDPIRTIIRATGSNQDGRTPGITQPSGHAQERLIRETYKAAGLGRRLTRYFEAHGTGTQIGDPTEAKAIAAAFMSQRPSQEPLYVGAVKTNIGHLEGASGIAGLIKTILVLEKGLIPRNLWFQKAHPKILEDDWNIKFPTENIVWPTSGLRRASINSFGFGGSNVHAVLDDAFNYLKLRGLNVSHCTSGFSCPATELSDNMSGPAAQVNILDGSNNESQPKLFVWSAADEDGMRRLESGFASHLSSMTNMKKSNRYLENLAYTLSSRRSSLKWKSFLVANSMQELSQGLEQGKLKAVRSTSGRNLGFVFTGQGAQWHAMGRELVKFPVFRESLYNSQTKLSMLGCSWLLLNEVWKDEVVSNIHSPAYSQPICTALQIALVDLLQSWNIRPSTVTGHSSGEIAAAYCSGSLSMDAALKIAFHRGQIASKLVKPGRQRGAMISVDLSEKEVQPYLITIAATFGKHDLAIGCINSPHNVTLSGSVEHIDAVKAIFDIAKVAARKLKVDVAYHSKAMNEVAAEYRTLIKDIAVGEHLPNRPTMFSSVTGTRVLTDELIQGDYWVRNMTSQVKFSEALSNTCSQPLNSFKNLSEPHTDGFSTIDFLEIGPHSALQRPIIDILSASPNGRNMTCNSILTRGVSATTSSFQAIGNLHCMGHRVDLSTLNNSVRSRSNLQVLTDLPEYPFNHDKSYWAESRISKNFRFREQHRHELLGTQIPDWNPMEAKWRHKIRLRETPWIVDHKVNSFDVYPAAGLLVMAILAARQLAKKHHEITGYKLVDIFFSKALMSTSEADDFETQLYLRPSKTNNDGSHDSSEFIVYTQENGEWSENCRGTIGVEYQTRAPEFDYGKEAREELRRCKELYHMGASNCTDTIDSKSLYEHLESIGLSYGPTFQVLSDIRHNRGEAVGRVKLRKWAANVNEVKCQEHFIHPTALDGVFQIAFPAIFGDGPWKSATIVPERIRYLWVSGLGLAQPGNDSIKVYAKSCNDETRTAGCSILGLDESTEEARLVVKGLQTAVVESQRAIPSSKLPSWKRLCYSFDWRPDIDLLSTQELLEYCKVTTPPEMAPDSFIEDVEFMCFSILSNTLEDLDFNAITDSKPHMKRYVDWMKRQRERYGRGELIHWRPDWPTIREDKVHNEKVVSRVENYSAEGKLYVETGKNLIGILEGKVNALDILFNGELAADYYKETSHKGFRAIEPYVDALANKSPGLNILEIGAGTGGFTAFLLRILMRHGEEELGSPRYSSYTFTDISPGFFEKARERFKDHADRMTFTTLNIETDPLQQGFQVGGYDLVVAANVLHATPKVTETLKNTRKLLRPGGKLILCELYNQGVIRADFSFGLLPGWWLSTEQNRQWGPLLPEEGWHDVLCRSGFSGVDFALPDYEDLRNRLGNTMVSTAVESSQSSPVIPRIRIIAVRDSELQNDIARHLKARLESMGALGCDIMDVKNASSAGPEQWFNIFLPEIEKPFLRGITEQDFATLQNLLNSGQDMLWITQGGGQSPEKPELDMITGLSRCVCSENHSLRLITLALEKTGDDISIAGRIADVLRTTFHNPSARCETEYEERAGKIWINRLVEANYLNDYIHIKKMPPKSRLEKFELKGRALALSIGCPGLLDTMEYVQDFGFETPLAQDEVEVKVKAVGMNFKDVLIALGRLSEGGLGNECTGIVTRAGSEANFVSGDRVCVVTMGTYKTYVRSKAMMVFKIPDKMSFAEAAAFPVVYSTAYQALYEHARLTAGESVLIHSGAGGTGQAAVQLARLVNAEIFVTVGSEEKKELVMDLYTIPEDHVFSSRGMSFTKGIKRMTKDRGVDVILNSLAGESLRGSWDCLAPFGRFVEIGKNDILKGNKLSLLPFNENRSFSAVNLTHMISERPIIIRQTMESVLALVGDNKISAPQPLHRYNNSQLEEAFRYLQGGQNTGKTILEVNEEDLVPVVPSSQPTYSFKGHKTYLIAGGLGGLGRQISRWMAGRGAKNLMLLSRSGAKTGDAKDFVKEMRTLGVNIATPTCDISDEDSVASVVAQHEHTMPPIKGCIQSSMVLEDSLFENMTLKAFNTAIKPKVDGSWNLHKLLPRDLEFFVLLSSACGITGVRGQANYASGNTYQDALARHRIRNGEKAVSIDLGMVVSSGYVADRPQVLEGMKRLGYPPLREAELFSLLEYHCNPALPLLSPLKCQVITGLETPASLRAQNIEEVYWMHKTQFRAMHQMDNMSYTTLNDAEDTTGNAVLLSGAESVADAAKIISESLVNKLSRILCLPREDIDSTRPMHVFGVDSLVAVEVRNWVGKELNTDMMIFEILGSESIFNLSLGIAKRIM